MIFNFGHFKMSVFALKPKALKGSLPSFTQNEQKILLICRYGCVYSFEHGNIYTATFRLCKTLPLALAHFGTAFLVWSYLNYGSLWDHVSSRFQAHLRSSAEASSRQTTETKLLPLSEVTHRFFIGIQIYVSGCCCVSLMSTTS